MGDCSKARQDKENVDGGGDLRTDEEEDRTLCVLSQEIVI